MKVTSIEEANGISKMKLDELFYFLQTFELTLDERTDLKDKELALQSIACEWSHYYTDKNANESLVESLTFLIKKFTRVVKHLNKCPKNYGTSFSLDVNSYNNANMTRSSLLPKGRRESHRNVESFYNKNERIYM